MRTTNANPALVVAVAMCVWALPLRAQQSTYSVKLLTPETALAAAQAALAHCRRAGHQVAVAVVDRSGCFRCFCTTASPVCTPPT